MQSRGELLGALVVVRCCSYMGTDLMMVYGPFGNKNFEFHMGSQWLWWCYGGHVTSLR